MTTVQYKVGDNVKDILQSTLYDYYAGKIDFTGPDPSINVVVETGLGGMCQMNNAIKEMTINSGLVINASNIEKPDGRLVTTWIIPFLANVEFEINSKYDNEEVTDKNYMIDGFWKNSYTYNVSVNKELIATIECIGKRPVFRHELSQLIHDCNLTKEYNMDAGVMTKYIMNCLKNLK